MRPFWRTDRLLVWGLLAILLAVLALLQYRWIDDLAEAERESLRSAYQKGADAIGNDVNRIVSQLVAVFDLTGQRIVEGQIGAAWRQWRRAAAEPDLLASLVLLSTGANNTRCQIWNSDAPANCDPALQARLLRLLDRPGSRASFLPLIADEHLLVAIPLATGNPAPDGNASWEILLLRRETLQQHTLPALIAKHLDEHDQHLLWEVVDRRTGEVVLTRFRDQRATPPDAEAELFRVHPGELARERRGESAGRFVSRWARARRLSEPEEPRGPPGGPPPAAGLWLLRLRHRVGSIEAAVDQARRLNLALGVGVWLVLACGTGMSLSLARRRKALLVRQMEFVAGVSHELRDPLAVIHAAGQSLAEGRARSQDKVVRYGAMVQQEARRLSEMVEQVLGYAGADQGRCGYSFEALSVPELVADVLRTEQPRLEQDGWHVELLIPEDLPPVRGDRAALAHCLRNLVHNAKLHAAEGRWMQLRSVAGGMSLALSVCDQGPGINPKSLPHLGEAFYRAGGAEVPGLGLGLAFVKHVLEAHGGRLSVTSEPGSGSCFTMHLLLWKPEGHAS